MASKQTDVLIDPLINNNPIALQILGICSGPGGDHQDGNLAL